MVGPINGLWSDYKLSCGRAIIDCDLAINRQYDPGHLMENLLYNELIRRGYSVDTGVVTDRTGGKNAQKEIDFVVNDADRIFPLL